MKELEDIMGGVPSKPSDPSRSLEVIGAGFSRTGTMTMQLALEELLRGPVSKISPGNASDDMSTLERHKTHS